MNTPQLSVGARANFVSLNWIVPDHEGFIYYELFEVGVGKVAETPHSGITVFRPDGVHVFYVMAIDHDSVAVSPEVSIEVDNSVPNIPTLLSIAADGQAVSVEWTTVLNADRYELVCNGMWVVDVAQPPGEETSKLKAVHNVWEDGTYVYEVRAHNSGNRWSAFSSPLKYTKKSVLPKKPVVIARKSLTQRQGIEVEWRSQEGMLFEIRQNGTAAGTVVPILGEDTVRFMAYAPSPGAYSFRVRAIDHLGRTSEWSEMTKHSEAVYEKEL